MLASNLKTVLILAPHTDDLEISCGGLVSKFIDLGLDVHSISFSSADESLPPGFPKGTLLQENSEAWRRLGGKEENRTIMNYQVRMFRESRQSILETMVRINKELRPDLVITPSTSDTHQDHEVIAQESFRAFKKTSSIWGFEMPWNQRIMCSELFVTLSKTHIDKKMFAVDAYKSQFHRKNMSADVLLSLAKLRGSQVDSQFAEAYESIRIIL